jgi:phosphocarrier protein
MLTKHIKINDEIGLHARPASKFAKLAKQFESQILVTYKDKTVNGKSSIKLITLNVKPFDELFLSIDGIDEENAMDQLSKVFN